MRAAVVENGVAVNIIEIESIPEDTEVTLIEAPPEVGIGWRYDGSTWSAPEGWINDHGLWMPPPA